VIGIPIFDSLRYRAGVFDVRGTLIGLDRRYREEVFLDIVRNFGRHSGNRYLSTFNEDDLAQMLNMPPGKRMEALERFGLDRETFDRGWLSERAMEFRLKYSRVHADVEALRILKAKGVKLAIVTSAAKRAADVDVGILKGRIGSRTFDEVVMPSYEPSLDPKPDPSAIQACVERLSVDPGEAFAVGDSERDIRAYQMAGVLDILLVRDDDEEVEMSVEPSVVIGDLFELVDLVIERGWLSRLFRRKVQYR